MIYKQNCGIRQNLMDAKGSVVDSLPPLFGINNRQRQALLEDMDEVELFMSLLIHF